MLTEQFSQHGFKVQIACVNLEILRTAQKGESMSVLSQDAVTGRLGATSHHVTSRSSRPSSPPRHLHHQHRHLCHQHRLLDRRLCHHLSTSWNLLWAKLWQSFHVLMSLERSQGPVGSDSSFLFCPASCLLFSAGFLGVSDYTRHIPHSGPWHWLLSPIWNTLLPSSSPPHPPSSSLCSGITFSVRLTLTILFNTETFQFDFCHLPQNDFCIIQKGLGFRLEK